MDTFDRETRSRIMFAVKSKNTGLENKFFALLNQAGIRNYKKHPENVKGSPDLIFRKEKIAVFIDSCFWHGCPKHLRRPASNQEYWTAKIARNVARDRKIRAELRRDGWSALRIWEHDLKSPEKSIRKIQRTLDKRSGNKR
ncbi:MAG: very short patch repair endonuclease [bacterium]